MKITVNRPVTVEVDAVRLVVPCRHGDEDIPYDHYGRSGDVLTLVIELNTGKVRGWPAGMTSRIHMKVVDEGNFYVLAGADVVAKSEGNYVPGFMPGDHYGDYVLLNVGADGVVADWHVTPAEIREFVDSCNEEG